MSFDAQPERDGIALFVSFIFLVGAIGFIVVLIATAVYICLL